MTVIPIAERDAHGCSGGGGAVEDLQLSAEELRTFTNAIGVRGATNMRQLGIAYDAKQRVLFDGLKLYVPYLVAKYESGLLEIAATEEDFTDTGLSRGEPSNDELVLIRLGGGGESSPRLMRTGATRPTFWGCDTTIKPADTRSYAVDYSYQGYSQGAAFSGRSIVKIGEGGVINVATTRGKQ